MGEGDARDDLLHNGLRVHQVSIGCTKTLQMETLGGATGFATTWTYTRWKKVWPIVLKLLM